MAATKTGSRPSSANGAAGPNGLAAKAKDAGGTVAGAARRARGPVVAAGATAAGLAGGMALGTKLASKRGGLSSLVTPRRRVLGVPVGRKSGLARAAQTLGRAAHELGSATNQVAERTDDVRQLREGLEQANRRSPIEVLLDGLTHRRGAHRRES